MKNTQYTGFLVETRLENVLPFEWTRFHLFEDREKAQNWLKQGFVNDKEYRVAELKFRKRGFCGLEYGFKIVSRTLASEFIKEQTSNLPRSV